MDKENNNNNISDTFEQMRESAQRRRRVEEMNKLKIYSEPIEILETEKLEENT